MKVLHLPVKARYFRQMQTGEKKYEYRLQTDYWRKRLEGREYDEVHIKLGYPKSGDTEKILVRPWKGFEEMVIT
ncbi:ASCH domain-containing protein [Vibrio parahaemolyticus]|nr:ASCH domain-containing protein [Vibrio parahaemolyticus]TOC59461.1 RNA-binding protein [Vibrio parahaemolyticus]